MAAIQLQRWRELYDFELEVKPVLPMAMRGHPVPRAKRLYIVKDAARRARLLTIPFGRIADPLGAGAQRALAGFPLQAIGAQQLAYCVAVAQHSWAKGGDIATDPPLRQACE